MYVFYEVIQKVLVPNMCIVQAQISLINRMDLLIFLYKVYTQ